MESANPPASSIHHRQSASLVLGEVVNVREISWTFRNLNLFTRKINFYKTDSNLINCLITDCDSSPDLQDLILFLPCRTPSHVGLDILHTSAHPSEYVPQILGSFHTLSSLEGSTQPPHLGCGGSLSVAATILCYIDPPEQVCAAPLPALTFPPNRSHMVTWASARACALTHARTLTAVSGS